MSMFSKLKEQIDKDVCKISVVPHKKVMAVKAGGKIHLTYNEIMKKVVRNGKVAVLVSEGFGAGWYSWHKDHKELLFHPKLVEMVEQGRNEEITEEWVKENLGIDIYAGGAKGLWIHWLPVGTKFHISEDDGAESVVTIDILSITA